MKDAATMREILLTAANEAYADHLDGKLRQRASRRPGFDGWLTAVRAFFLLLLGMTIVSLYATT